MKDKKVGSVLKTETKVIAYVVICLVIIVLGISYALFFEVKGNEKNQIVKAGTLEFTYANGSQITNATNSDCFIPMSGEEALTHSECEYKISITNTGTLPGNYNINLNSETVENPLALSKLKVILKKEGQVVSDYPKEGTTTSLVENEKIEAGKVINYTVQVYVDKELVDANDDEKNISIKINGDAVVNSEEVNPIDTSLAINYIKNIATVENGDGLYTVSHDNLEELGPEWNKTEYRYAGANPNNYVSFNNEIWRIIGLVNVKTESGIEQRIKIIRADGVKEQKNFGNYIWNILENDWTKSTLSSMLNGIYYKSEIGECYKNGLTADQCDFNTGADLPKGLNEIARNMIDKEIIWNLGGHTDSKLTVKEFYEKERSISVYNDENVIRPTEWKNFNEGIALIYISDYGYAVGGDIRNNCMNEIIYNYNTLNCKISNWLNPSSGNLWTLVPYSNMPYNAFDVNSIGFVDSSENGVFNVGGVWPTIYLKSSIKILPNSQLDKIYGSVDNPFILE